MSQLLDTTPSRATTLFPPHFHRDWRFDGDGANDIAVAYMRPAISSACGDECDLDDDGKITQKDADLMVQLCDSEGCSFRTAEYVGGMSPAEPDMRAVRNSEAEASARFLAAQGHSQ